MSDKSTCPCEICQYRIFLARAFDIHIWGDDCFYECECREINSSSNERSG